MTRRAAAMLAVLLALPACTGGDEPTLTVLAASSLSDAFEVIARDFEGDHDVDVRVSVAGSQQLATQVLEGAPADVFASADQVQMDRVVEAGLAADDPVVFARNALTIVTAVGAPRIISLTDLDDPGVTVVLAAEEVPAGRYARQVLDAFGVEVTPVSLEPNVRAVLSKVALGEADAGLVYASDLVTEDDGRVSEVPIPDGMNVVAEYPVVALDDADQPDLAAAFVEHVRSPAGQARLWALGFRVDEPPS